MTECDTIKKDRAKKFKTISLSKRKTVIEFKAVDDWLVNLRYLINGRETYSAQIILPDVPGRVDRLKKEGFNVVSPGKTTIKRTHPIDK